MILGIESSCDETAAAVVTHDGVVVSSVIHSQVPIHAQYGGVVPELASRSHLMAIRPVIAQALTDAAVTLETIDAVAVTDGPGLAGCLLVGIQAAKALAWSRGLPLIPVHHIQAHVHAPFLSDEAGAGPDGLTFPYIALAVSGGHTSLMRVDAPGQTETLGQTIDDAAGEAFDKVAKMMGLPYPGGVHIDRLSQSADATEDYNLPRPILHRGLDFSFSGLKTAARYLIEGTPAETRTEPVFLASLAASLQRAIVDVLVTKAMKACKTAGIPRLVIAGGVACNSELRAKMVEAAANKRIKCWVTPARYCTDNAAMVAGLGAALLAAGVKVEGDALLALDIHTTRRPRQTGAGR
ncbi:MAG: N6-L-threonylcarbamoyladenine synthase [Myxococcota bacterium]|jgi:N6-L-threonylcarbamoyladenine synthase